MPREVEVLEGLCEQVGRVGYCVYEFHSDFALRNKLANFEVAALDVTRTLARLHVAGEVDGALVVDMKDSWLELVAEFV